MNVRFCPSCRSLVLADFRFCPYCGAAVAVKGPGLSEALEAPFAGLGRAGGALAGAEGGAGGPFALAEERLRRLEADMDLLLEAMEKERS